MILIPPATNYINIFGYKLHYYSLCIFAAILLCYFFVLKLNRFSNKLNKEIISDFIPYLVIFAILGARIYYVALSWDYFFEHPTQILMIANGGLSIHGAFIGGIIAGLFYFRKNMKLFLPCADIFCAVLPLGQAIGRWGNFFNQEAFGLPVSINAPVKLFVSEGYRPLTYFSYEYFHPVFLYESVLDLILFIFLYFIYKKTTGKCDGLILFLYVLFYSLIRIFLEFLRLDTVKFLFGIPFPVIVSAFGILTGILGALIYFRKFMANH